MPRGIAVALVALLAACGLPAGALREDAWPRLGEEWQSVPHPPALLRDGARLVAQIDGCRFEASRPLAGVVRVRIARGEFDEHPSLAVAPGRKPDLDAPDAELEAPLRQVVPHLQLSERPGWRWFRPLADGERIVGLGERPASLDQRGRRAVLWNTAQDLGASQAERWSHSIPFWISIVEGRARGYFVDDPHRLGVDAGVRRSTAMEVDAEDGDFDLYVIEGPTARDVVERYTALTGRPAMPPAWALGFQVRRTAATQERLLRLAGDLHDARVPCVAIAAPLVALDGEVWDPDAPRRFPDFPDFARRLDAFGLKFVSIVVPGLRRDARSEVYGELSERRFAVATAREREYVGEAAIGECAFPDFTRDEAREWWGDLLEPLAAAGVGGVSNEANEPVVLDGPDRTMPEDNRHAGLGGGEHRRFHNAYGALMARAASDGLTRLRPGRRPFVLTGSSWSGAQRWAAAWTGTGPAEWSRLRTAMTSVLSLGQSGQPFVAVDLGGEEEGAGTPTDELRARWLELATLFPLAISWTLTPMSLEGAGPESAAIRAALARRARLLPLLYTLAEEAHRKGTPIVRPVEWAAPGDRTAAAVEDQFLLGDDVLVAPVDRASATSRSVYVPAGTWYPFDPLAPATATPIEGPTHIRASAPLGTVPMYARGGSVVATAAEPLALEVFPGRGESELYEDAGDGYGFERGECTRRRFTVRTDGVATTLVISPREGTWAPPARRVTVRFHEPDGIRERTFDDDGSAREIRSDLEIAER